MNNDTIYAKKRERVPPFVFDDAVVEVFPDMINRSVPAYALSLDLMGLIAARYVQEGSNIYDLGCSLGAGILAMEKAIPHANCHIIGIDNSASMVKRCLEIVTTHKESDIMIDIVMSNLEHSPVRNASMVVLNYTLQFIPLEERQGLIDRIFSGLLPGGALFLSEKVVFPDQEKTERFIDLHHDYKRSQGYSDMEISQKRDAIENVLIPETISKHQSRLLGAGFRSAELCLQTLNFISLLAIK